jgi:hypothetical protein
MPNPSNISSLLPASLLSKLASTNQISFPNQQKLQKLTVGNQGLSQNQDNALLNLNERKRQARTNKSNTIREAREKLRNKKITQDQFNDIEKNANATYDDEVASIENNKKQVKLSKDSEVKNFRRALKNEETKIKAENAKLKLRTTKAEIKSKAELAKQVLTNPSTLLLIYPGLGLLITNAFLNFITQRKKLEEQVEAVNLYIDTKVVDEPTVIIATNLKNNTIRAINNAIAKLKAIEAILKQINTALKIANLALKILGLLLVLLPAVPGAVLKVFEFLNKVISGISSILPPCLTILSNEIQKLKELIERLKQIIIKLNNKTLNILTDDQLLKLIQTILPVGDVAIFSTLTAVPVSGSEGFVNIGGRIVPLNATSAAGSLSPTTAGAGLGTTAGTSSLGTGTGAGTGTTTGVSITPTGIGAGTGTGTGTGIGIGTGIGAGTGGAGTGAGTGTGTGIGTPLVSPTTSLINTGSNGTTNGTGIGVTTTGGTGAGGVNVGPVGTIPGSGTGIGGVGTGGIGTGGTGTGGTGTGIGTGVGTGGAGTGAGSGNLGGLGTEIGLDSGNSNDLTLLGQPLFPIDINQISLGGLDEAGLNSLEQLPLELIQDETTPSFEIEQVPSFSDQLGLYKGFKFQIKEEQDARFVVRGTIKRRYAVAINRQGVEVLRSEYSFTLDPNDLVDQLKLVIDRQKLQG